ncbi:hypothetical protein R6Q59_000517 [Mikania micrantha]
MGRTFEVSSHYSFVTVAAHRLLISCSLNSLGVRLDDALKVFVKMLKLVDGKPNVAIYNTIIHSFVKYDKFEKGLEFYGRMIKDRVKPDAITFNILINGEGKLKQEVGMAYEMIKLGCGFSNVTCEILVDGLMKEARVSEACDLVLDFSRKGVLPTKFDYFGLIETLCDQGNAIKARLMVDEIWDKGNAPDSITCTILIEGLRRVGNIESALNLMGKMLKCSIVPDSITFNCLLGDLCNSGIGG